jgi:hypothetical protein
VVIPSDGSEYGLGQLIAGSSVPENLDVENQIHPQHGE